MYKARHALGSVTGGSTALALGTAVAFVTALLSVSWLLKYVSAHNFRVFAVYRVVLGLILLALIFSGVMR